MKKFYASDSSFSQFLELGPCDPMLGDTECWMDGDCRLSLHMAKDMSRAAGMSGMIGHYEALDLERGSKLLAAAAGELYSRGAKRVVGPMNGSTWCSYRLPLYTQDLDIAIRSFPGEPIASPEYVDHFLAAGFRPIENYQTRVVRNFLDAPANEELLLKRTQDRGIEIESLKMEDFYEILRDIYQLSLDVFSDNAFFTPIPFEVFAQAYEKIKGRMDPDFVLLAKNDAGRLIGFVLAFPDPGQEMKTLVYKTLAVAREARLSGLGLALFDEVHKRARDLGYTQVIHALMHDLHNSVKLSKKRYESLLARRYSLFGK